MLFSLSFGVALDFLKERLISPNTFTQTCVFSYTMIWLHCKQKLGRLQFRRGGVPQRTTTVDISRVVSHQSLQCAVVSISSVGDVMAVQDVDICVGALKYFELFVYLVIPMSFPVWNQMVFTLCSWHQYCALSVEHTLRYRASHKADTSETVVAYENVISR